MLLLDWILICNYTKNVAERLISYSTIVPKRIKTQVFL